MIAVHKSRLLHALAIGGDLISTWSLGLVVRLSDNLIAIPTRATVDYSSTRDHSHQLRSLADPELIGPPDSLQMRLRYGVYSYCRQPLLLLPLPSTEM